MTPLRKIVLEELQRRNYSEITTRKYLRVVSEFAKYFGKFSRTNRPVANLVDAGVSPER